MLNFNHSAMKTLAFCIFLLFPALIQAQFDGPKNCLEFSGGSKYVNVPTSSSLSPTSAITVEAWIYATSWGVNAWTNTIVSKEDWASGDRGYVLRCGNSGRLSFNVGINSAWSEVVTTTTVLNLNQWHHVAGTCNSTGLKIFVDGIEVGSTSVSVTMTASPYDLRIGECAYSNVSSRPFIGRIDEVRVWNTALTVTQLRDYMCKPITSSHPNYSNLKGYWKLDEGGAATTTADSSGNLNTGTLTSGPVWTLSGAGLGESAAYSYTSPFNVSLDNATDSIAVSNFSSAPTGVQIYRISGLPANLTLPAGYTNTGFSDAFWGIRVLGSPNATYSFLLKLKSWPATSGCMPTIIERSDNSTTLWLVTTNYMDPSTLSVTFTGTGKKEYMVYFGRNSIITYAGTTTGCSGDSIVLTANAQTGFSYLWLNNNQPITGATASSLVTKQTGNYSVKVTNAGNCTDTSSVKTLTFFPRPNVQITPSGPVDFCEGGQVTLYASGAKTFLWNTAVYIDSIVVHQNGKYILWGVDTNNCMNSDTMQVQVFANPIPDIIQIGPDLTTPVPYATYQWYLGNLLIPNASQQIFTPVQNGIYKVEVTDSNGCSGVSANYSMNNVGIGTLPDLHPDLTATPNPTGGLVTFTVTGPTKSEIIFGISDYLGRTIINSSSVPEHSSNTFTLDLSGLAPGIYFYHVDYQGKRITKKLILQ
jgi:hypothetical protein